MARTQQLNVREIITLVQKPDGSDDYQGDYQPVNPSVELAWGSGTTASKSDKFYADYGHSLAASGTLSLDLAALVNGPDGAALALVEVRAILIRNRSTDAATIVTMQPNGTNGWTGLGSSLEHELHPGAIYRIYCGTDGAMPVSASDKVLDFVNADATNAATLDIVIVGVSA